MATQPDTGNAVARRADPNTPAGFRQQLRQNADKITLPQGIAMEAFENVIFSATVQNPDLLKADRQSLLLACLKSAQDGLLPNGRDAALVVFSTSVKDGGDWVQKKLVQYMPMVAGLRSKILRAVNHKDGAPVVKSLQVGVVYKAEVEQGYFRWERGSDPEVQHRPMLMLTEEEAADDNIVAAYSIATFHDGFQSCEVLRRFEIDKVRQCSQTGALGRTVKFGANKGKPIEPKGPWVDWFAEMAKKTALRRHSKVLPMAGDIVFFETNDEASEFKAADNTANILGSAEPDAPQLEDRSEEEGDDNLPPHDKETGELHEEQEKVEDDLKRGKKSINQARTDAAKEPVPEKASAEGNATSAAAKKATPAAGDESGNSASSQTSSTSMNATTRASPSELEQDEQTGVTKSPAELKADELLTAFRRSETVIDLEKHKKEFEKHRGALEDEHISLLDAAYERESDRLYGHPAGAK